MIAETSRQIHQPRMPALLLLIAVTVFATAVYSTAAYSTSASAKDSVVRLHDLFEAEWQRDLRDNPIRATYLGDRRYNDRWPDASMAAIDRRHAADRESLEKLAGIDRSALPGAEQLNYDLFKRERELRVAGHRFRQFLIPLDHRGGVQTLDEVIEVLPFAVEQDFRDWIARLERLGTYVRQTQQLMQQGIEERRVHPRVIMERVPDQLRGQIVETPEQSPFYKPFLDLPESLNPELQEELQASARQAVTEHVVPAFQAFLTFLSENYLPAARPDVGAWALPDGNAFYEFSTARHTTTQLTPDEIHEIGLEEVTRIREEMNAVIEEVGFGGGFNAFLDHLRTHPDFYFDDADDLLREYQAVSKRLDPELVKLFGKLPRIPYGVRPIPEAIAPDTTTAYYQPPPPDGSRPGYYYVNLYRPEVRPKYEIEVLSVHEAVPGHHLQIALALELEGVPAFRRVSRWTAFVEGWGLYAEQLGYAMGLYEDPYSRFGQLTYDMWRAVRLVVDTGMHHKGWTRQQAIDYFAENAAKTEHDIINEIDRYIAWPGQALAYKVGQRKILELRRNAERTLGDAFDIRSFHDAVLAAGAIPLDILESRINEWISAQQAR